jgi:hypothetical protein
VTLTIHPSLMIKFTIQVVAIAVISVLGIYAAIALLEAAIP